MPLMCRERMALLDLRVSQGHKESQVAVGHTDTLENGEYQVKTQHTSLHGFLIHTQISCNVVCR